MKKCQTILLILLMLLLSPTAIWAKGAGNVGLISFTAVSTNNQITLAWQTATELDSVGFHVVRVDGDHAPITLTNPLIPADGNPTVGAAYSFVDETAVSNIPYTYQLVDIQSDGSETVIGSQTITLTDNDSTGEQMTAPPAPQPVAPAPSSDEEPSESIEEPIVEQSTVAPPVEEQGESQPETAVSTPETDSDEVVESEPEVETAVLLPPIQETPATGYPEPDPPTATPAPEEGYVEPTPLPPVLEPPTPTAESVPYVPPPTAIPTIDASFDPPNANQGISTIGEDVVSEMEEALTQQNEKTFLPSTQGRVYLWLGFLIALLILGTAVIGTTLIFSRKTQ